MSDYTNTFSKTTGNTIEASDFSTEFDAIQVSSATKADEAGATLTTATLTSPKINEILDTNGNEEIIFTTTASAVNEVTLANAATGNNPTLTASGETNVGFNIVSKGTGAIQLNGTNATHENVGYGGRVFISETTISGTPQFINFDNVFDSTYDMYIFELVGVLPTTDAETISLYVGTGGTPTYQTGANYTVGAGHNTNSSITVVGNAASDGGINGIITIANPSSSTVNCIFYPQIFYASSVATPTAVTYNSIAYYEATTAVTSFRFDCAGTNTFASGTIRLYGVIS